MSKKFLAAAACCLMCATSANAQYQQPYRQPAYQSPSPQYSSQERAWDGILVPGQTPPANKQAQQAWGQPQPGQTTSWSSARFRQDQGEVATQPRDPAPRAVVANPQAAAAQAYAPTMVSPTCGADYSCDGSGYPQGNSCDGYGCRPGYARASQYGGSCADGCCGSGRGGVGSNYFDNGQSCGGCDVACDPCGCDRYMKVFGGWNWLNDTTFDGTGTNFPFSGETLEWNEGWVIGGALGRRLTQNLSTELEFAYRNNTPEGITGLPAVDVSGFVNSFSLMGNLIYEFGEVAGLRPYIGGGLGIGFIEGDLNVGGFPFDVDDSSLAYQGIVGVSRQLSARTSLFGEYRYFAANDVDLDLGGFGTFNTEYEANNFILGLQFVR